MNSPTSIIDQRYVSSVASYATTNTRTELFQIIRALVLFLVFLLAIWLFLDFFARRFPYVRNGASLIGLEKRHLVETDIVFPADGKRKVAIFGHSKILSGFIPDTFDALSGGYSYNLAVPGSTYFVPLLKPLIEGRQVPNYILLIGGRVGSPPEDGQFHLSGHDQSIIRRLFPFRDLVRDGFSFLLNSRRRGGPATYYELAHQSVLRLRKDRGYYFIEGQSGYPNHRLPDNFSLPADRPSHIESRTEAAEESELRYLLETVEKYQIRVFFVPSIFRVNERAEAPSTNSEFANRFRNHPLVTVAGPDYWVLPNQFFSDAVHLNPEGAHEYTTRLWKLMEPYFKP